MTAPRQSPTMLRNLDPEVWERIKREARRHDLSAGALANLILREWLDDHTCSAYGGPLEVVRT